MQEEKMLDIMIRARLYTGTLLSGNELAKALGIDPQKAQQEDFSFFANECLRAAENPHIRNLSEEEQVRVIASAGAMLDNIFGGC